MNSFLLTNGDKSVCVIKPKHKPSCFVYRLNGMKKHGFQFYGTFHKFELALSQDISLLSHPYGLLGSCVDLSGRVVSAGTKKRKPVISGPGRKKIITLEDPDYSLSGEYSYDELQKLLNGYFPEKHDLPYASISTSAFAVGDRGDDFYLNTLFFMTSGYGVLTKISAVAGRDLEDCCSPEYYYQAYKVQLNGNPLKRIKESDIVSGTVISRRGMSSSPRMKNSVEARFNDNPKKIRKFDELIDKLFMILTGKSPEHKEKV